MLLTRTNKRPLVMGIVNVTPDSFSDGGQHANAAHAIAHAQALIDAGADVLDIGGESTRPGAAPVLANEELDRVLPVIEALARSSTIPLSIDTMKPNVAQAAIRAGASWWNDVSALRFDQSAPAMAAELAVPIVLMHMQGEPGSMQDKPYYDDVTGEVIGFLRARIEAALAAGVLLENIMVDPGIGFGKRLEDNLALTRAVPQLARQTGCAVLYGASRKRFIEVLDSGAGANERLGGSLAAALYAAQLGANILRVHDVLETVQALKVWQAMAQEA